MNVQGVISSSMINPQPFTGAWKLGDLDRIKSNGLKVFSTFACGGGSTMGYKLAGYDVIGALEIEKRVSDCYIKNLKPKYHYQLDIRDFNKQIKDSPKQFSHLMDLDILDGSPPCSQFSTAGHREKNWGKIKKYGEGKHLQTVDDLFFRFIETVEILQPKVVVAENVKGLIKGKARGYVKEIVQNLNAIGYKCWLFLLNAKYMGVAQSRERVIFIATPDKRQASHMAFNEPLVSCKAACEGITGTDEVHFCTKETRQLWENTIPGKGLNTVHLRGHRFNEIRLNGNTPAPTLPAMGVLTHWAEPRNLSRQEFIRISSFPDDYDFDGDWRWCNWVCGMSVPPFMIQRIALEIGRQWFGKEYDRTPVKLSEIIG